MAYEIPDIEPETLRAGDTITWRKTLASYPATDSWVLYYRLIAASHKYDITAAAEGSNHLVTVSATTSAAWVSGEYAWTSWVIKSGERHTIEQGRLTILPDLAAVTASGYDGRTHAQIMLAAIKSALESLSSGERLAVVEADLSSRKLRYDFTGLMKLRRLYEMEVRSEAAAERIAQGLAPRNKLMVRL